MWYNKSRKRFGSGTLPKERKNMKVLLFALNGSWVHSNLAIRCLRPPLERAGFEVKLLECNLRDRTANVLEQLYTERADVYGFSCYIWNLKPMMELGESLKQLLPSSKLLLGGPEVSFDCERFEQLPFVDAVISGEGESVIAPLCLRWLRGEQTPKVVYGESFDFTREGILYRDGEPTGGILYYESSRGCPYSCAYCLSSATHGVRMKTAEQTLADMEAFERLQAECKIIKFVDRTFNADKKRACAIWRGLLSEKFTKHYHFEVCASLLDEECFEVLSMFPKGKIQLEFGLQSTNAETLKASSRHIQPEAVIGAVRRVREMGNIHVHLDLIAGLPFEDYQRFAQSFDDAYDCCDLLQLGFLKLLHGTELRRRAQEYGYCSLPEPPYTVLQSKWLPYPQMQQLRHIAETMERYAESGHFAHTLSYVMPQAASPFRFWEGLSLYLRKVDLQPLQKISQPNAFRYLLTYIEQSFPMVDRFALRECTCLDFQQYEHKNPPAFLRNQIGEEQVKGERDGKHS